MRPSSTRPSTPALAVHGTEQGEIVVHGHARATGTSIEKRYRFPGNSYLFDVDVSVRRLGQAASGSC